MNKRHVFEQDYVQMNEYDVFVASISLRDKEDQTKFNALFSLTKITDLEEDLKNENYKKAYIFHGYNDTLLALSRIWNSNPNDILYGNEDCIDALRIKLTSENANPRFISNLSDLTKRPQRIADYIVELKNSKIEIFGLDNSFTQITLIWFPEINAMLLGENVLRNINRLFSI